MKKNIFALVCAAALSLAVFAPVWVSPEGDAPALGTLLAWETASAPTTSAPSSSSQGTPQEEGPFGGAEYEPGVALVTFAPEWPDAQAALGRIADDTGIAGLSLAEQGEGYAVVSLPENVATDKAIGLIAASDAVAGVQPNFIYHVAETAPAAAIEPRATLDLQTGVVQLNTQATINEEDGKGTLWHLAASNGIDAYGAWDVVKNYNYEDASDSTVAKKRVTVAVLDNCFNIDHPDLADNVVDAHSVTAAGVSDGLRGGGDSDHGTHVAGIIAARANNGAGTAAGVSYNARVMPVRVCGVSKDDITTDYLVRAYRYVLGKAGVDNVRVINLSIGGGRSSLDWSAQDKLLFNQIDTAHSRGIVTVTAACNVDSGSNVSGKAPFYAFPADYPTCVSVIALDKEGKRYSSSNYNKDGQTTKDIAAPGVEIYSTKRSGYGTKQGTSMAAPVVAGTLALMFAHDSSLTADEAVSKLYSTATDVGGAGWDAETGYGRVNAQAAVATNALISGGSSVAKGGQTVLSATGVDGAWTWTTSDPSVATVDAAGAVTGVATGSAEITATNNGVTLRRVMTVYDTAITSQGGTLAIADGTATMNYGQTAQLTLADGQPAGSWIWSSSDSSIVSVNDRGFVTAEKVGTAKVTVTLGSDSSVSSTLTVKVTAVDIASASISIYPQSYVYDGQPHEPAVLLVSLNGRVLIRGVDYMLNGYSDNTEVGMGKVTILGLGNYKGTAVALFSITGPDGSAAGDGSASQGGSAQVVTVDDLPTEPEGADYEYMYRLYNSWTGEHFYTADGVECANVVNAGWTYEGVGWKAPAQGYDVYRLYNSYGGEHHYTLWPDERQALIDAGWTDEGVGWLSADATGVPLYREYNPYMFSCNHNYTTDLTEHNMLVLIGWIDEGTAWYGV